MPHKRFWSEEEIDYLSKNYASQDLLIIRAWYESKGRKWQSVLMKARALGLSRHARRWNQWPDEIKKYIYTNYPTGRLDDLKKYFTKLGIRWPQVRAYAVKRKIKRLVPINDEKRLGSLAPLLRDSPEIYYWIGFFFADGCVQRDGRFTLSCAAKDKQHLDKFSKVIGVKTKKVYKAATHEEHLYVSGCNEQCVYPKIMTKFDLRHRKSHNPPVFKKLLDGLQNDEQNLKIWLIGFIDGDGTIRQDGRCTIMIHKSWKKILQNIQRIFGVGVFYKTNASCVVFSLHPTFVAELKQIITRFNLPHLERKWHNVS